VRSFSRIDSEVISAKPVIFPDYYGFMKNKYWVLSLLSLLSIITFLDRNAISLAGQRITGELGLSEGQFGWILSAFTIAYGLFEIPTGQMGDRYGARRILARVVLWWSFFTMLTGFVGGFISLFFVRFPSGQGRCSIDQARRGRPAQWSGAGVLLHEGFLVRQSGV
jgi:MFS family permease